MCTVRPAHENRSHLVIIGTLGQAGNGFARLGVLDECPYLGAAFVDHVLHG